MIVVLTVPLLDKLVDTLLADPVHLFAGIWGTMAATPRNLHGSASANHHRVRLRRIFVIWIILNGVMGIRVSEEAEINGLDSSEMGMEAYQNFERLITLRLSNWPRHRVCRFFCC